MKNVPTASFEAYFCFEFDGPFFEIVGKIVGKVIGYVPDDELFLFFSKFLPHLQSLEGKLDRVSAFIYPVQSSIDVVVWFLVNKGVHVFYKVLYGRFA